MCWIPCFSWAKEILEVRLQLLWATAIRKTRSQHKHLRSTKVSFLPTPGYPDPSCLGQILVLQPAPVLLIRQCPPLFIHVTFPSMPVLPSTPLPFHGFSVSSPAMLECPGHRPVFAPCVARCRLVEIIWGILWFVLEVVYGNIVILGIRLVVHLVHVVLADQFLHVP